MNERGQMSFFTSGMLKSVLNGNAHQAVITQITKTLL